MANFQQAAAAAMQAAVQGMQGIPGVSIASLAPAGTNYADTMTAIAMQQAAAAAAVGQQFYSGFPMPVMTWATPQAATVSVVPPAASQVNTQAMVQPVPQPSAQPSIAQQVAQPPSS